MSFASGSSISVSEGTQSGVSTDVEICGKHEVGNNTTLRTGRHTFVLTAKDPGFPMPKGSKDGKKQVTISSNENFSFGNIHYDKQGVYEYEITRNTIKSKDIQEDDSKYTVRVAVFNDGKVVTVLEKSGIDGKPDKVVYSDKYVKHSDGSNGKDGNNGNDGSTRTGDDASLMLSGAILGASAMLMLLLLIRRRKKE